MAELSVILNPCRGTYSFCNVRLRLEKLDNRIESLSPDSFYVL